VVDGGDDFMAIGDAERAAGQEIDLHVDDEQGVALVQMNRTHIH
jgi:hypothetical protein